MVATVNVKARVDKQGRLVIPAELRCAMGIEDGGEVSLALEDDALRVTTLEGDIRKVQAIAAKYKKGRTGLVDEFLAERRREAERE